MQDEFKEMAKLVQDSVIQTNQVNKRLTAVTSAVIIVWFLTMMVYCIRDSNIAKSYFNQSLTQESTVNGLKQEFKGGD